MHDSLDDNSSIEDTICVRQEWADTPSLNYSRSPSTGPSMHPSPPAPSLPAATLAYPVPSPLASQKPAPCTSPDSSLPIVPGPPEPSTARRRSRGARGTRAVNRYERNVRYLTQQWGSQDWFPSQFLKDKPSSAPPRRLNGADVEYLVALTKTAVANDVDLSKLYQPGGVLYEAMATTSSSGTPGWTAKTVRTALRLLNERLESKDRSDFNHQDNTSRLEEGKGNQPRPEDVQDTVTAASMVLERIYVEHQLEVQATMKSIDNTLAEVSETCARNAVRWDNLFLTLRSLDAHAADRVSAHRPASSLFGTQHRLERCDAILTLQSPSSTGAVSDSGIDCRQPPANPQTSPPTLPAPATETLHPDQVLSLITTLTQYCAQHPPRPDIISRNLSSYREKLSTLTSARQRAYTAKASAETDLARAVERLERVGRIATETDARLGVLLSAAPSPAPLTSSSKKDISEGEELHTEVIVTTADEAIKSLMEGLEAIRSGNRKAVEVVGIEVKVEEKRVANLGDEIERLEGECRGLEGMLDGLRKEVEINDAWVRLVKGAVGGGL
ncbi:hypothetical protein CONLIGDRAFT_636987 [Coniochaeta ligniaria NRRL 30616]|uniref:Uncharacterized protein n=1 Tax=Coniochaeta ligniaria NRRL 30616 TaxID=1408157 RepID=A0A1J7IA46_9PEZI|nr:hypothetical protein CONLIGDRAFT_636987 [Coniochaeta ligniaria NRRL 30616]